MQPGNVSHLYVRSTGWLDPASLLCQIFICAVYIDLFFSICLCCLLGLQVQAIIIYPELAKAFEKSAIICELAKEKEPAAAIKVCMDHNRFSSLIQSFPEICYRFSFIY
jgi:hypothetical protein